MKLRPEEISSVLAQELDKYGRDLEVESVGTILQVGDGIARIYGLQDVMAGELVKFPGDIMGIVLDCQRQAQDLSVHLRTKDQRHKRMGRVHRPHQDNQKRPHRHTLRTP